MILSNQCFNDSKHLHLFFEKPFFFIYVTGITNERYYWFLA